MQTDLDWKIGITNINRVKILEPIKSKIIFVADFTNLDIKKITDSNKFWKTVKPFFSDKGTSKHDIILIEGNEIIQEDAEVAKILVDFF